MKTKIGYLLMLIVVAGSLAGCDNDPEALEIQKMKTYDEQYYANLRAYKRNTEGRAICFGWYAAYAPKEGVDGWKTDPASWGERIAGVPDSMDIVSLWMGIPSDDPASSNYSPIAYADMRMVQQKKGTRFVAPSIVRFNKVITLKDGTEYDLREHQNDEGIEVYAKYLVDQVLDSGIDGVDLDYEPEGDWMQGDNFVKLVQQIGQYFGPKGSDPTKLLCVDFFREIPPIEVEPYVNYFIQQNYAFQNAGNSDAIVTRRWQNCGCPIEKYITTDSFGDPWTGAYTQTDGNTLAPDGSSMLAIEGQARWAVNNGAAGFGAFYFGRDYYTNSDCPYYNMRRCIQIANPAVY